MTSLHSVLHSPSPPGVMLRNGKEEKSQQSITYLNYCTNNNDGIKIYIPKI
jgi:hypothetical protein